MREGSTTRWQDWPDDGTTEGDPFAGDLPGAQQARPAAPAERRRCECRPAGPARHGRPGAGRRRLRARSR
ncbi:hypothetical protein G5V59_18325 [Nocardioides sp. W3-2-3]|nr:hypothetical protein [Nocardioides convexus]